MPRIAFLLLLVAGLLFAQEPATPKAEGEKKPEKQEDEHRLRPDHAPTPYTAKEIRDACLEGRRSTFLIEVKGKPPLRQTFTFTNCTEDGTDLVLTSEKEDGTPAGPPVKRRATWKQLQAHGSYPERSTKISKANIHIKGGEFDCILYHVTRKGPEKTEVSRVYFAKRLPGPPVFMEMEVNGNVTFKMTLVAHQPGHKKTEPKPTPNDPKQEPEKPKPPEQKPDKK